MPGSCELERFVASDPDAARREVIQALIGSSGNTRLAAVTLGVSRTQLWRVLDRLGIRGEVAKIRTSSSARFRIPGAA